MSLTIRIVGGARLAAALKRSHGTPQEARQELFKGANRIFAESQRQTPIKTGTLRGSGTVTMGGDEAKITYGGAAAGYAIYVHEILRNAHPIGNAKFLERPMIELGPGVLRDVTDAVERSLS